MPWIALDCGLIEHRKLAALSDNEARWGWIVALVKAKAQRPQGQFSSADHLAYLLGDDLSPYVEEYVKVKLLDRRRGGALVVHDWSNYQRGVVDLTAAERQRRWRDKHGNNGVTGVTDNAVTPVTDNGSHARKRAVPVPVYVKESTEGVQGEEPDAAVAFQRRTGEFPGSKILGWLNELSEAHGEGRLVTMIQQTPMAGEKVPDYLRSVRDRLRSEDHQAERNERLAERAAVAEKRGPVLVRRAEDVSDEEAKVAAARYMAEAKP